MIAFSGQGRAGQGQAEQGRARQNRAGQAELDRVGQGTARHSLNLPAYRTASAFQSAIWCRLCHIGLGFWDKAVKQHCLDDTYYHCSYLELFDVVALVMH